MQTIVKVTTVTAMLTALVGVSYILYTYKMPIEPDRQTKKLCRWYADKDHEMELAPTRWQWFVDRGINPNTDYDWYQSCIDHNTKAVAR